MSIIEEKKYWWSFVWRGGVALLFALSAFLVPGLALEVLVLLFAAFIFVDGIFAFLGSLRAMAHHRAWWLLLLEGLTGIAIGGLTFLWPGSTELAIVFIVGAWAIITGVLEIAAALSSPWDRKNKWLFGIGGVLSTVMGVLILIFPVLGALYIIWLIAAYALLFGVFLIVIGMRLKRTGTLAA